MHADLSDDQFETVPVCKDSLDRVKCQTGLSLQILVQDKGQKFGLNMLHPRRLTRQANLGVPWINREKYEGSNFGILQVSNSIVEDYQHHKSGI